MYVAQRKDYGRESFGGVFLTGAQLCNGVVLKHLRLADRINTNRTAKTSSER